MNDFLISQKGDLLFTQDGVASQFRIAFVVGEMENFMVSFATLNNAVHEPLVNGFTLSFLTADRNVKKSAAVISGADGLVQAIQIRLLTQRGEIRSRLNLGSDIHLYKHRPVNDATLAHRIEEVVRAALVDVLSNATVKVVREKVDHNLSHSGYVAEIYQSGRRLLRFYI